MSTSRKSRTLGFQVIQDDFILQILETIITNLPQPLHLVLITREDPSLSLARLRANNQLTEIRSADLRFSGPNASHFLNEVMDCKGPIFSTSHKWTLSDS